MKENDVADLKWQLGEISFDLEEINQKLPTKRELFALAIFNTLVSNDTAPVVAVQQARRLSIDLLLELAKEP